MPCPVTPPDPKEINDWISWKPVLSASFQGSRNAVRRAIRYPLCMMIQMPAGIKAAPRKNRWVIREPASDSIRSRIDAMITTVPKSG